VTVAIGALVFTLAGVGFLALGRGSQASASHVSCGDEITADTTLDRDLVDCPNNGIVIGADDITLDLNGHTVGGDGTEFAGCPENEFCDIGLLNDGHDGVTLRDGSVRDFAFGAVIVGARHNRVVDITVSKCAGTGIILFKSSRNRLIGNAARANGLQLDQGGISLNRSHHNLVKRNALRRNGDLGVFMEKSDHNQIRKNRMRRNPEGGIIAEGDGNVFSRNRIVRGGGGILITIVNRGEGVVGNVVRRNYVRDPRQDGISVDPGPKRTLISHNHVVGAGRDGISVLSRSTRLTKNRAVRNDRLGIKAVKGVIDGGGNRASGNGDGRQCVNVKCR
jgi:parallel beta-helix repeat protein